MEVMDGSNLLDASDPADGDVLDNKNRVDGDGVTDEVEAGYGTEASNPDSDANSLTDRLEMDLGTDPLEEDRDGLGDYPEVMMQGTNLLVEDTDGSKLGGAF